MPGGHKNERRRQTWERVSEAQAERWAYRDQHSRRILEAVAVCDVELECPHGYLPADPHVTCGCWRGLEVREAEALRHDVQALTRAFERHHDELKAIVAAIHALTEVVAHVDRNVTAVGYQVSENGR